MNALEWLQILVSYALQAGIVVGAAFALDHWSHGAQTKARIWTGCFLSLIGLMIAAILLPRLQWIHPWSSLEPTALLRVASAEYAVARGLLAIWGCGISVLSLRWVWQCRRLHRFVRSCEVLSNQQQHLVSTLVDPGSLLVGGRQVRFRQSRDELGPFCYQLHQPFIFVPPSMLEGDETELQHVLHHELAHLRTQHPMQLFLQRLLQTIFWFHPLVWMSGNRAALVREFVCDEAVATDGVSTAAYLRTLLRLVETRTDSQHGTFAIGRSAGQLRRRARRLVHHRGHDVSGRAPWSLTALLVVAVSVSQLWLPTNPLASSRSSWSRWPGWTAQALHLINISVPDFDPCDERVDLHELLEEEAERQALAGLVSPRAR